MNITFRDRKLEKLVNNNNQLLKKFGNIRANKIMRRLNDLSFANTLEDARNLPGHYHELTGNRKGEWACDLDQPYRLIFVPYEDPIPQNEDGQYLWNKIYGVEIIEICNYHIER